MPESWFVTGPLILAHEIGHALGGNHPAAVRCADFDDPTTCQAFEAVDRDIMTSSGRYYLMPNNYERRRWGWHPPGVFDEPVPGGSIKLYDLHSPVLAFVKDGPRRGRFYFRNLGGIYSEYGLYPEARRNWGQFERYREIDESYRSGIAVRIGHANYGDPEALSILIDPNQSEGFEDAPLRENERVSIGGLLIECLREHHPAWGTRMKIDDLNQRVKIGD
jgi:hypothetical protein